MHVGVRDVIIQHAGYATIREGLAALGLEAVELALSRDLSVTGPEARLIDPRPPLTDPGRVARAKEAFDGAGVRVGAVLLANNFNSHHPEAELRWVADGVRIAAGLGAGVVRLDAAMTGQQELPFTRRVDIYSEALGFVLDATSDLAIPLGIENHGLQGNDPAWLRAVLDKTASPRVGLTLDPANFYWSGMALDGVYQISRRFAPDVKHVHSKNLHFSPESRDTSRRAGWDYGRHVCPLPDGDIDHGTVISILRAAGYDGGLYIEDESLGKYDGTERARQLGRGVEHLKTLLG
jgi:sugar phosphate isomerase/epimerase